MVGRVEGAGAGGYGSKAVFPAGVAGATHLGGQSVSGDINMAQAILTEAIATFFLVFVVFGTAVDPSAPKVGGFAIGLTVTADILAIGSPPGGGANPARSLGAAPVGQRGPGAIVPWVRGTRGGIAGGGV